jgi:hypothetical protein
MNEIERFWSKVDRRSAGDCWEWQACCHRQGYGWFYRKGGQQVLAHRYSYELHHGSLRRRDKVLHTCDNPRCVNPSHLRLGTQADNVHDMMAKGRSPVIGVNGESNHQSKLTRTDVVEIRWRVLAGASLPELAERYGVSVRTIRAIEKGEHWTHV